ncbi:MAG: PQQ-like beta-propeller repeat protein [Caulobacterales bacterium]|nr:PQQ-like beta-propeller repeat protein [Caulobacterales bacterium]
MTAASVWLKTARGLAALCALASVVACSTPFSRGDGGDEEETSEEDRRISFLALDQTLSVDASLTGQTISLPGDYANAAWPNEGGYATHAVQHPRLSQDLRRVWRRDVGPGSSRKRRVSAPPIVGGDQVFAVDGKAEVSAYDLETGDRRWTRRLRPISKRDKEPRGGGVAFADDKVFVTTGYGYIAALDAASGEMVWRRDVTGPVHSAPTVADGRVFAVTFDNELYAIDAATGTVLWTYQSLSEPARILTASSPAVSGDVVVAPFASGELVALRIQNGRVLWSEALTRTGGTTALSELNDIAGSPVIVGDVVYAVSHSGVLAAMDLGTGQRIWAQPAGGIHMPWVVGDYLFVVTNDAQVACLSRVDGRVYWMTELTRYRKPKKRKGRVAWAGPVLAGGRLLVVSSRGELLSLDPFTGEVSDSWKLGDDIFIPPVVARETALVMTDEARLIALR